MDLEKQQENGAPDKDIMPCMIEAAEQRCLAASDPGRVGRARWTIAASLAPLLAGGAFFAMLSSGPQQRLDEFALGDETATVLVPYLGNPIHWIPQQDINHFLEPALERGLEPRIAWLGNSQLHAINQPQEGDRTAPVLLAEHLRPLGIEVLGFSQPNASLQEHEVLFEYLMEAYRPDTLVLPLVFDDMREDHIRAEFRALYMDTRVRERLARRPVGDKIERESATAHVAAGDTGRDNRESPLGPGVLQERVEENLNQALTGMFPLWERRGDARGRIALSLYHGRNTLLGIDPSTKRPVIRGPYQRNMESLANISRRAREKSVKVVFYIAPIRPDVEKPYVDEEYQAFKAETAALANGDSHTFLNLENLVPGPLWGSKNATKLGGRKEIDFMHFQGAGHVILSEAIRSAISKEDP